MTNSEIIRFALWAALLLAVTVTSTAVAVQYAVDRWPADVQSRNAAWWGAISVISVVAVAALGGLFVFRPATPLKVIVTWPLAGGLIIGLGVYMTISAMGQADAGAVMCQTDQPCDTSFGLGAVLISILAAIPIALIFLGTSSLKRVWASARLPGRGPGATG